MRKVTSFINYEKPQVYERNQKKIYEKGYFLHSMRKVTFFIIYEEGNLSHRKIFMRKVTFFINFL